MIVSGRIWLCKIQLFVDLYFSKDQNETSKDNAINLTKCLAYQNDSEQKGLKGQIIITEMEIH